MTNPATTRWARRLLGLALVCAAACAVRVPPVARPAVAPGLFARLASGVVLVRGSDCSGHARVLGSGFLVGRSVVMTARHVVDPGGLEAGDVCTLRARVDGRWTAVAHVDWWTRRGDPAGRAADVATLALARPADAAAHVFDFRKASPAVGTPLAMLGYPLGQPIALTQGHLLTKESVQRVPALTVRLLGAEGASGAPLVDGGGHVAGVLQQGLGASDVLGQQTAGVVQGIDLAAWWGGWKIRPSLCRVYVGGGVPGCPPPPVSTPALAPRPVAGAPTATAAARPVAVYAVRRCWLQETGDSWRSVDVAAAIASVPRAQLSAHPRSYWAVVTLASGAPGRLVIGARLVNPQGLTSGDEAFFIDAGARAGAASLDWASLAGHALVFDDPWLGTRGRWAVRFSLPNGEVCDVPFRVR